MHFDLIDRVLDHRPGAIVTLKSVSNAEEYLQDHFPTFPVLPGVFMLESMVQAARELLKRDGEAGADGCGVSGGLSVGRLVGGLGFDGGVVSHETQLLSKSSRMKVENNQSSP